MIPYKKKRLVKRNFLKVGIKNSSEENSEDEGRQNEF